MKVRLFSVMSLIASLALLLALVPGGAVPTVAQAQPTAPNAPASESLNALSDTETAEISVLSVPSAASAVQAPGAPFGYVQGRPITAAPRTRTSRIEADSFDGATNDPPNPAHPLF